MSKQYESFSSSAFRRPAENGVTGPTLSSAVQSIVEGTVWIATSALPLTIAAAGLLGR